MTAQALPASLLLNGFPCGYHGSQMIVFRGPDAFALSCGCAYAPSAKGLTLVGSTTIQKQKPEEKPEEPPAE